MKKLIGIYDTKTMTPEQIFEEANKALQEKEKLKLLNSTESRKKKSK